MPGMLPVFHIEENRYEGIVKFTDVNGEDCLGCKNRKAQIMVTMVVPEYQQEDRVEFQDFFMTEEQALILAEQLRKVVQRQRNERNGTKFGLI